MSQCFLVYSDTDECSSDVDNCHNDANCTNTPGSFTCTCREGYTGNGTSCLGILIVLNVYLDVQEMLQYRSSLTKKDCCNHGKDNLEDYLFLFQKLMNAPLKPTTVIQKPYVATRRFLTVVPVTLATLEMAFPVLVGISTL